jgi:uncharacterized protein (DUF2141 family)
MKNLVLALAAVAVFSASALAGGTKGNSSIVVKNCDEFPIAVIVLAEDAKFPSSEEEFFDQGGKVLDDFADKATYRNLKQGNWVIYAAYVFDGEISDFDSYSTELGKNEKQKFCVFAFDEDTPTIEPQE